MDGSTHGRGHGCGPIMNFEDEGAGRVIAGVGRGLGNGRGAGVGRPPLPPSSMSYRAPRSIRGHNGTSNASEFAYNEVDADDVQGNDQENEKGFDKADWSNSENTTAFCTICVEEIIIGNRSNGFMTGRG
ncbi:hypothetical protein PR202_ga03663 [Eleusine coracana subsp. coracana]|uniref:Uncharacterized protein n=1 Tax=Eleusine coracana subsp. coracana TaxID=191504 RepID=A0AAV5BPK3_ELECO|nr:hypothetical protein PR202_ga03663 [Eleusine coracana subsp. coracana]